ncbi:MAG: chromosome segregation protein SMC, partial [Oscillospiraceae bacterium]
MYLKYVEIHGFKSFPDKTRIEFKPGLTGVVGPNGSGKSNISDAIRWVLGEQSTKSLRSDKMQDVIFSGTSRRSPMGFAEVSLCLDNSDRRLEEYGDEIVIGRRYYRSGFGEYSINGAAVRLKDVRETFMNTGLSRDGYSIIEQGRIAEIVSSKPEDRREIFEEATGIARYRFRKDEAEKELAAAEGNIERLNDILGELESRIGPLKKQSETAKKFLELSDKRKSLEVTLYCDTIERQQQNVRVQEDRIAIANRDYSSAEEKLSSIDEQMEKLFDRNRSIEAELGGINEEKISAGKEASEASGNASIVRADIERDKRDLEDLRKRREDAAGENTALLEKAESLEEEALGIDKEVESLSGRIADAEAALAALAEETEASDAEKKKRQKELASLSSQLSDSKAGQAAAESMLEDAGTRLKEASREADEAEKSAEEEKAAGDELKKKLESIANELVKDKNTAAGLSKMMEIKKSENDSVRADLDRLQREIDGGSHRLSVLEDMEKSQEGFSPSVKSVISAGRNGSLRGIIGTVSSVLSIEDGCELAIETALGYSMQNIITEDERAAKDAIAFLKETRAGRATFLPLDTVQPYSGNFSEVRGLPGFTGVASELVKYDPRYDSVVKNLLGRTVIAEDINSASRIARTLRYRNRVVTLDGQLINAGGSFTGGYSARSTGVFSRRKEMEKLRSELQSRRKKADEIKASLEDASREYSKLEARLTAVSSSITNLEADRIRAEEESKRHAQALETINAALEAAEARKKTAGDDMESARKKTEEEKALQDRIQGRIQVLEALEEKEGRNGGESAKKRQELSDSLTDLKLEKLGRERDAGQRRTEAENLRKRAEDGKNRNSGFDETEKRILEAIEAKKKQVQILEESVKKAEQKSEELKKKSDDLYKERVEVDGSVSKLRSEQSSVTSDKEKLAAELSRLEERKTALQKEVDQAVAKLWEDYELTRPEAEKLRTEYTSITALRQEVSSVRSAIKALGTVNVSAIDEYREVSERYEFMSGQVRDVEESRKRLLDLINGITSEMREIFTDKFSKINENF